MHIAEHRLAVRRESQHDNASGQGYRECFSSSCAAIARYWGRVSGDDAYNRIRARYGDTTSAAAQVAALQALGLDATFVTNGNPDLIRREIRAGRPLAVGWIHKGPIPSGLYGDGHWSVISGFNDRQTIHQDPYGEADIIRGGYINTTGGSSVPYSWVNWRQRWEVAPAGGGWRYAPGQGWAVLVSPRS